MQTGPADQSLAYSVQVELSQLAVRITDKNGNWIGGVKKEDLELFEDGVLQEVLYWDEIGKEKEQKNPPLQTHPSGERTIVPASATPTNNVLLIFDACNSGQTGFEKHKKYVREFLQNFNAPNTMFSIIFITQAGDYQMVQNFTSDKDLLLEVIQKLRGGSAGIEQKILDVSQLTDSNRLEQCSTLSGFNRMDCAEQALRGVIHLANSLASEEQTRSGNSLRSLETLFQLAEHIPGQKSVILVSEGMDPAGSFYYNYGADVIEHFIEHFGLPPSERALISEMQSEASRSVSKIGEMKDLIRSANAAGLAVYWINPEFGKKPEDVSSELTPITNLTTKLVNAPDMEFTMRGFAEDTGGAALSSNDMSRFYRQIGRTIAHYYLISYKSSRATNDGRFHKVEVRTKKKDCVLSYAKTFKDFELRDRIVNGLAAAHDFPELTRSFPLQQEVYYFRNPGGKYHVMLHTGICYQDLEPRVSGETVIDDIHLSFIVRDNSAKILFDTHPIIQLRNTRSEFETLKRNQAFLDHLQSYVMEPGNYQISLAVMDLAGWRSSAGSVTFKLPGNSDSCPSVSPLVLASSASNTSSPSKNPTVTKNGEIVYGEKVFKFSAVRLFPANGSLTGFYQIYNAKGKNGVPAVFVSFRLYRDHTVLVSQTPEHGIESFTDPLEKLISNFFSVPYKNLAVGSYEFEIRVRDGNNECSSSSRVSFEIGD